MTKPAFTFNNLSGGYGDTQIIFEVSGALKSGEVLGIFGRNGVGKTTLARLLAGALPIRSGSLQLSGDELTSLSSYQRRRCGIGYMPQTGMVFDNLTVRENLSLAKAVRPVEEYFEAFPRLAERQNQLSGSMSGGERKILSFVRTMLEDTSTIILDEPSEGVQPENIERMQKCILERKSAGTLFVLVEQNLTMLSGVTDLYLGLESGRMVFEGTKEHVTRDDLVKVLSV